MSALKRVCCLIWPAKGRHGRPAAPATPAAPLTLWPLADFEVCRPDDLVPFSDFPRVRPYDPSKGSAA